MASEKAKNRRLPLLLTIPQVAEVLQVADRTVYRMIRSGELQAVKVGGSWRVPRGVVEAMTGES